TLRIDDGSVAENLQPPARQAGRSGNDNLLFVNAVLWVLRSGAHWHDLPDRHGKCKTVHKHFTRWANAGVWEKVLERFRF
ncbi:MAG: transposase, partial [Shimia sp.]|nr:transposase [Shimia sp.]